MFHVHFTCFYAAKIKRPQWKIIDIPEKYYLLLLTENWYSWEILSFITRTLQWVLNLSVVISTVQQYLKIWWHWEKKKFFQQLQYRLLKFILFQWTLNFHWRNLCLHKGVLLLTKKSDYHTQHASLDYQKALCFLFDKFCAAYF